MCYNKVMDKVEVVIERDMEGRRFRFHGSLVIIGAFLFTAIVVFATMTIARMQIAKPVQEAKQTIAETVDGIYTEVTAFPSEELSITQGTKLVIEEEVSEPAPVNTAPAIASPNGKKTVYLTFDDGPGPYTERLLDVLKVFLPIPSDAIPEDAILREFIGGSYFE